MNLTLKSVKSKMYGVKRDGIYFEGKSRIRWIDVGGYIGKVMI